MVVDLKRQNFIIIIRHDPPFSLLRLVGKPQIQSPPLIYLLQSQPELNDLALNSIPTQGQDIKPPIFIFGISGRKGDALVRRFKNFFGKPRKHQRIDRKQQEKRTGFGETFEVDLKVRTAFSETEQRSQYYYLIFFVCYT